MLTIDEKAAFLMKLFEENGKSFSDGDILRLSEATLFISELDYELWKDKLEEDRSAIVSYEAEMKMLQAEIDDESLVYSERCQKKEQLLLVNYFLTLLKLLEKYITDRLELAESNLEIAERDFYEESLFAEVLKEEREQQQQSRASNARRRKRRRKYWEKRKKPVIHYKHTKKFVAQRVTSKKYFPKWNDLRREMVDGFDDYYHSKMEFIN